MSLNNELSTWSEEDFELAVKRGIEWLDEDQPGWLDRIDLDTLELESGCTCVIGQLHGNFNRYLRQRRPASGGPLAELEQFEWAQAHGFMGQVPGLAARWPQVWRATGDRIYETLNWIWKREIRARREM